MLRLSGAPNIRSPAKIAVTLYAMTDGVASRERDFWDHEVPRVEQVIAEFRDGPPPSAAAMIGAIGPLVGKQVLDFGCGGGTTALWLAARGARVTAVDVSPVSISVAREAAEKTGIEVEFRLISSSSEIVGQYEGIVGHLVLHHVDIRSVAPALASVLCTGGRAAFVETTCDNPLLAWARKHLTGRLGIPRYGSLDEHPLNRRDRDFIRTCFGELQVSTPDYHFLRVFDRQVLHYKYRWASNALKHFDDHVQNLPVLSDWGYTKLLVATKTRDISSLLTEV